MKLLKFTSIAAALLLIVAPAALAQGGDGYYDYPQEVQTKGHPAGTSVQPGSQLLFLLDSGIAPADINPDFDPTASIIDNFGPDFANALFTNFISITNTNPTDAVTIHFRYFNEDCEDVLDFLVVLTCNDTMLVDAFNFTIPGSAVNVRDRFFGPAPGDPQRIAPLPSGEFGSGRFLLHVTASGDAGDDSDTRDGNNNAVRDTNNGDGTFSGPEDLDKFADWLFPQELTPGNLVQDCPAVDPLTIGVEPGVNDNNLNVFNASAISFNYLSGFHTVSVARGGGLAAYGVSAWARPAVNLSIDFDPLDNAPENPGDDFSPQDVTDGVPTVGDPTPGRTGPNDRFKLPDGIFDFFDLYTITDGGLDGDGPLAPKRCILSGSEQIWLSLFRVSPANAATPLLPPNFFYLRQDAHGGDTIETNCEGFTPLQPRCDSVNPFYRRPVVGGALDWTLFPIGAVAPADQFLYMVSVKDDYNGSNNTNNVDPDFPGALSDNAYRLDPAATYYELIVFNNDEDPLAIDRVVPIISPPPPFEQVEITLAVKCIDTFSFNAEPIPSNRRVDGGDPTDFVLDVDFGTFSVEDLFSLDSAVETFLSNPIPVGDELGPGWIRFDRQFTRDFWYTPGPIPNIVPYDGERGTYVTIAKNVIFQSAFGVSWYLPLSATSSDAATDANVRGIRGPIGTDIGVSPANGMN